MEEAERERERIEAEKRAERMRIERENAERLIRESEEKSKLLELRMAEALKAASSGPLMSSYERSKVNYDRYGPTSSTPVRSVGTR